MRVAARGGGGLGPPLRNLEGNPPKRGPTTGETDKEGWVGVYEQREHVCLVRTPMAYSASTATSAPLQDVFVLEHTKKCMKRKNGPRRKKLIYGEIKWDWKSDSGVIGKNEQIVFFFLVNVSLKMDERIGSDRDGVYMLL